MIEQLFLLTKMDIGEKALPLESLDLGKTVEQFIEENRLNWNKNGADFTITADKDIRVRGSPLLLERILENLVSNSIKYKTENQVHMDISVEAEGEKAKLRISDDGPGVPEKALGRLKEAFFRTDKARSRTENGSGLGLAIVERAARLMGGTVDFQNRKPHGLTVVFTLPLEDKNGKTNTDSGR